VAALEASSSTGSGGGVTMFSAGSALGGPSGGAAPVPGLLLVHASIRDVGGLANHDFVKKLRAGFVARRCSQEFRILTFCKRNGVRHSCSPGQRAIPSTTAN
jgi:hypothetical protein